MLAFSFERTAFIIEDNFSPYLNYILQQKSAPHIIHGERQIKQYKTSVTHHWPKFIPVYNNAALAAILTDTTGNHFHRPADFHRFLAQVG